jgi:hypothetical protein
VYDYRLRQVDNDGSETFSPVSRVMFVNAPTAMRLHQNYPNPFSASAGIAGAGTTEIAVELPTRDHLMLEVFDAMGRRLATLADGEYEAGYHPFTWQAVGPQGALPAGTYFYRLTTPKTNETRQMLLVK